MLNGFIRVISPEDTGGYICRKRLPENIRTLIDNGDGSMCYPQRPCQEIQDPGSKEDIICTSAVFRRRSVRPQDCAESSSTLIVIP